VSPHRKLFYKEKLISFIKYIERGIKRKGKGNQRGERIREHIGGQQENIVHG
jgi:hypothetical protein